MSKILSSVALAAAILLAPALSAPALAQQSAALTPARLTDKDRQDVERLEKYLNSIKTMVAKFVQTSASGNVARGQMYLQRPGKFRFEYEPPAKILIVADGNNLAYRDDRLDQTSYASLDATPAGFLSRQSIKLSGDYTITEFQRGPGWIRVRLVKTKEPQAGSVQLSFSDSPLFLAHWIIADAQGQETKVALVDPRTDVEIDPKLFVFRDPKFGRSN
jgi:outer membrane lipoprotein-sorting protein